MHFEIEPGTEHSEVISRKIRECRWVKLAIAILHSDAMVEIEMKIDNSHRELSHVPDAVLQVNHDKLLRRVCESLLSRNTNFFPPTAIRPAGPLPTTITRGGWATRRMPRPRRLSLY
jgi:hypothetical protein